jgi:hypothetical protein
LSIVLPRLLPHGAVVGVLLGRSGVRRVDVVPAEAPRGITPPQRRVRRSMSLLASIQSGRAGVPRGQSALFLPLVFHHGGTVGWALP